MYNIPTSSLSNWGKRMDQANIGYNLRNTEVYHNQRLCGERLIDQEIHTKEPLIEKILTLWIKKINYFPQRCFRFGIIIHNIVIS